MRYIGGKNSILKYLFQGIWMMELQFPSQKVFKVQLKNIHKL